jgi:lincosamide nucleotidyltransferase A/C/D/E
MTVMSPKREMAATDVLGVYASLEERDVKIWIDGGWAVDALLGEQTRFHEDLDLAVERKHLKRLKEYFKSLGYTEVKRDEDKMWDLVLGDDEGHEIEVHAFVFDDQGFVIEDSYWDGYSSDSLTGFGSMDGKSVRCVSLKQLMKTHDETRRILKKTDYADMEALRKKFDF